MTTTIAVFKNFAIKILVVNDENISVINGCFSYITKRLIIIVNTVLTATTMATAKNAKPCTCAWPWTQSTHQVVDPVFGFFGNSEL